MFEDETASKRYYMDDDDDNDENDTIMDPVQVTNRLQPRNSVFKLFNGIVPVKAVSSTMIDFNDQQVYRKRGSVTAGLTTSLTFNAVVTILLIQRIDLQ